MPLEIGKVVDGTVTGITNFGAFIQLPDGNTGLCHISEIADEYVKNVKDYLKEQQVVKVKIIEMNGKGKVSLSIRKAIEPDVKKMERKPEPQKSETKQRYNKSINNHGSNNHGSNNNGSKSYGSKSYGSKSYGSKSYGSKSQGGFEDMLSKFLKDSDEKLKSMKKNASNRRGNGFNRNAD